MSLTISSSEAQNRFGAMIQWVDNNEDGVIVERRGKPTAALISYAAYEEFKRLREEAKRLQAIERIKQIRREVQATTQGLSAEEAYRLANFSEELIPELVEYDNQLTPIQDE